MNPADGSDLRLAIRLFLDGLELSSEMFESALKIIPSDIKGLLAYGSRARGDALEGSDLDLLALVADRQRTRNLGNVSLSFYTTKQLTGGIGSLFGAHLRRDAKIVYDPMGDLARLLDCFTEVDAPRLMKRVREFSVVFGALDQDLPKYLPGLLREARYLLRSALYARAIQEDNECFSVRELAKRYSDPKLSTLLSSRPSSDATEEELMDCLSRLTRIVGELPANAHGSLESLIVNEWSTDSETVALAMLALGGTNSSELEYVEVRKVLL